MLVAASDGLLVLGDKKYPHRASVLNPLTGSLVRFASAIPRLNRVRAAVTGSEDDPSLSLVFAFRHDPYSDAVSCAQPTGGELCTVQQFPCSAGSGHFFCSKQASMATYRGHVYLADRDGQIVRFVITSTQQQQPHHPRHNWPAGLIDTAPEESLSAGRCRRRRLALPSGSVCTVCSYWPRPSLPTKSMAAPAHCARYNPNIPPLSPCFSLPLSKPDSGGPLSATQPRPKRYKWWRPAEIRVRRHPPLFYFLVYINSIFDQNFDQP